MRNKIITNLTPPPSWASANEKAAYRKAELEAGNKRMGEAAIDISIKPGSKRSWKYQNSNFGMGF